jgi:hypothetical protein
MVGRQEGALGWLLLSGRAMTNVLTTPIYTEVRGKVVEVMASRTAGARMAPRNLRFR